MKIRLMLLLPCFWMCAQAPLAAQMSAAALPAVDANLVRGNNEFALALYAQLAAGKRDNVFFSPYSISSALAMTYAGAKGQTAQQISETLRFSPLIKSLPESFAALDDSLNTRGQNAKVKLVVANALWGQKGLPFLQDFLDLTKRYYGAGLHELDFRSDVEAARGAINAWVEQETAGKIKNLIPSGALSAQTRLVLTDAIYFKGRWISPFDKSRTEKMTFHTSQGRQIKTPFMNQTKFFNYAESQKLQILSLPYAGGLSMVVLLPQKTAGLGALEKNLNLENLNGLLGAMNSRRVNVYLPKFKMASGFDLVSTLKSLGMTDAFVPPASAPASGQADFSGMDGRRDLWISDVIHKAFVSVDEQGTEAAAATAVAVASLAMMRPSPPVIFRADHPFVFLIRDGASGSILFLGKIANPQR